MKKLLSLLLIFYVSNSIAQEKTSEEFQRDLNLEYANPEESPLKEEDRLSFIELPFFEINKSWIVKANFKRTTGSVPFQMKTTTDRLPTYEKYGEATFEIEGTVYMLNIYQNHKLRESEEYKDYLFLPFTDATNGDESYGGGRFIDLKIPEGAILVIDFNQAYNPLCAYNHKYSCPIPPKENDLNVRVEAGVKYVAHE